MKLSDQTNEDVQMLIDVLKKHVDMRASRGYDVPQNKFNQVESLLRASVGMHDALVECYKISKASTSGKSNSLYRTVAPALSAVSGDIKI